jgi:1,4-alpha-glucan branching enzyme
VPEGLSPVKFVLAAPGASEVAVIGSFNGWNAAGWTMRRDTASGLWTLKAALPPGSHEYVFLIDGATTVTDAAAALSADDGFGSRNSVLLVKNGDGSLL